VTIRGAQFKIAMSRLETIALNVSWWKLSLKIMINKFFGHVVFESFMTTEYQQKHIT